MTLFDLIAEQIRRQANNFQDFWWQGLPVSVQEHLRTTDEAVLEGTVLTPQDINTAAAQTLGMETMKELPPMNVSMTNNEITASVAFVDPIPDPLDQEVSDEAIEQ